MNQKHLFKKSIVALLFAMVSFAAWADDSGSCGENVTYTFVESTGTLTISGTGAMGAMQHPWYDKGYKWAIKKIVIEEGVTWTSSEAFCECYSLTSVVLPSTLVAIAPCTFESCTALESVSIPNSVFYIGDLAFARCTSLKNINIPSSVTMIGGGAFVECTSLETLNVAKENNSFVFENGVLYSKDKTAISQVLSGVSGAFEIPSTVTNIDGAFYGCSNLTSVTIPNSVTSIGEDAFYDCSGLTSITIPNTVTNIGEYAFWGCSGLTNIAIPSTVTSFGEGAFWGCSGLTSITIPSAATSIEEDAFHGCSGLTSIAIPSTVTSIGDDAFHGCSGLTNIAIPNAVTSIGENAFSGCSGLTSATIPSSVTTVGNFAFWGCSSLESITCEATTPPTGGFYITDNIDAKIYVPAGSVDAYSGANGWGSLNVQAMPSTGVAERAIAGKAGAKKIMPNGFVYIEADGVKFGLSGNKLR